MLIWDAVILAGGRARRLGGIDKPSLVVGGRSLLEHAAAATDDARARVLVGPHEAQPRLPAVLEEPRWGGPTLALATGLAALPDPPAGYIAVVAADQPAVVSGLRAVLAGVTEDGPTDGWVAEDPSGRRQPLLAVYRRPALQAAVNRFAGSRGLTGASLQAMLAGMSLTSVPLSAELCRDVDTPEDLAAAGAHAEGRVA